jgi:hypothetical protein
MSTVKNKGETMETEVPPQSGQAIMGPGPLGKNKD